MRKYLIFLFFLLSNTAIDGQEITIIAHRGNSSEAPENTFSAFYSAAENRIPYIECDVHLTKEGVPVVVHDRLLSRTTNLGTPFAVEELTLAEVKALDCGEWFHPSFKGERIPTLHELVEAPLGNTGLMIEIKDGSAPDQELVSAVLSVVKNNVKSIIIGSKKANIVRLIRKDAPHLTTIGIAESQNELEQHLSVDPEMLALDKNLVSELLIHDLHSRGKTVWVWTVDTPQEFYRIKSSKADGVITNHPRMMVDLLGSLSKVLGCYTVICLGSQR